MKIMGGKIIAVVRFCETVEVVCFSSGALFLPNSPKLRVFGEGGSKAIILFLPFGMSDVTRCQLYLHGRQLMPISNGNWKIELT